VREEGEFFLGPETKNRLGREHNNPSYLITKDKGENNITGGKEIEEHTEKPKGGSRGRGVKRLSAKQLGLKKCS